MSEQGKTVDDVIEYAQERGVTLSKKNVEFMREGISSEKITIDYLYKHVNQIADKKKEIGLRWEDKEKPTEKGVVSSYKDKTGKVHCYIIEREVKNSDDPAKIGKKFYVANRIDQGKDEHAQMATRDSLDGIKNTVSAYFTQIIISEINREKSLNKQNAVSDEQGMDI